MADRAAILKGTATSWKRARRLAELTDGAGPGAARKFLSKHKNNGFDTHLDAKSCDKRNPSVRAMIQEFQKFLDAGGGAKREPDLARMSEGDPTRAPRAGAKTKRKYTRRQDKPIDTAKIPGDLLFDLRAAQRKHGVTPAEMLYCINLLARLVDEDLDLDRALREIKADMKDFAKNS